LPDKSVDDAVARELIGLQSVIALSRRPGGSPIYDIQVSGGNRPLTDLVASAILKPLNAKLGQACFNLGATTGEQVAISFDTTCADQSILSRLDTNPPASLYAAPPARQRAVIKDADAMKRLTI